MLTAVDCGDLIRSDNGATSFLIGLPETHDLHPRLPWKAMDVIVDIDKKQWPWKEVILLSSFQRLKRPRI